MADFQWQDLWVWLCGGLCGSGLLIFLACYSRFIRPDRRDARMQELTQQVSDLQEAASAYKKGGNRNDYWEARVAMLNTQAALYKEQQKGKRYDARKN